MTHKSFILPQQRNKYVLQLFVIQMQVQNRITTHRLQLKHNTLENLVVDKYRIEHLLDYGSECEVYLAENINTQEKVAVKLINLKPIRNQVNPKLREISMKCVQNEVRTMTACDSQYLLKCYEIYENEDFKLLIIEYCSWMTLQSYIQKKQKITEGQAFEIVANLIQGLMVLHENHIVLRDLKAENIIKKDGIFKITNFHFAERLRISQLDEEVKGPCMGSLRLMAPEIIARKPYGLKIDVWSLGVLFFQMVYGTYPFHSTSISQFYRQINSKDYFSNEEAPQMNNYQASDLGLQFLKLTLAIQSRKRANIEQLYHFMRKNGFLDEDKMQQKNILLVSTPRLEKLKVISDQLYEQCLSCLQQIKIECEKVVFIFHELLTPLKNSKRKFTNDRELVQFQFLLSTRSLVTINTAETLLNKNSNLCRNISEYKAARDEITALEKQARQFFDYYSKELTDIENRYSQIISDWFKKHIYKAEFHKKQRFFLGIQNLEYTKQEQIDFTLTHFRKHIQNQLDKYQQLQPLVEEMNNYKKKMLACRNQRVSKNEYQFSHIYQASDSNIQ